MGPREQRWEQRSAFGGDARWYSQPRILKLSQRNGKKSLLRNFAAVRSEQRRPPVTNAAQTAGLRSCSAWASFAGGFAAVPALLSAVLGDAVLPKPRLCPLCDAKRGWLFPLSPNRFPPRCPAH